MIAVEIIYILLLAIILFFINNYITIKEPNNLVNNLFAPTIYIIIASPILDSMNLSYIKYNLYLVVIVEMFIRLFYNYVVKEQEDTEIKGYIITYFISIIIAFITNIMFINKVESVIPDNDSIKVIIWLLILFYIYPKLCKITIKINTKDEKEEIVKNKQNIIVRYAKFKNLYNEYINIKEKNIKLLLYSMLIYESKKTSKFKRKIDTYFFGYITKVNKLGIMQIETKNFITDEESIVIASNKITNIIKKSKLKNNKDIINKVLKSYYKNSNVEEQILKIYKVLEDFENLD